MTQQYEGIVCVVHHVWVIWWYVCLDRVRHLWT